MKVLLLVLAIGLAAALLPWWVPVVLFLAVCLLWNEKKIAREKREWREEFETQEALYRMGDRR